MTKTSHFKPDALGEYIKPGSGGTRQKLEKIEKMALQIYYHNSYDCSLSFEECWKEAERIYKFVKQKQEEANDGDA